MDGYLVIQVSTHESKNNSKNNISSSEKVVKRQSYWTVYYIKT